MDFSPGFHPAGRTSSGFSCTYCKAWSVLLVSSTLLPIPRLLMVECWITPSLSIMNNPLNAIPWSGIRTP
uniref:Uncharacterized protein n=1 Tax=Lotus japonicus TaxID=34305 RepID=I3S5W8_LOTJA|nr:unknown [Lotus japonicus]